VDSQRPRLLEGEAQKRESATLTVLLDQKVKRAVWSQDCAERSAEGASGEGGL